jgi:NADPH-dependent curcumin reductase CurA
MPGMTAYVGCSTSASRRPARRWCLARRRRVGSIVGQMAKLKGCARRRVAGSRRKCDYVVKELGFDACVSYRSSDLFAR